MIVIMYNHDHHYMLATWHAQRNRRRRNVMQVRIRSVSSCFDILRNMFLRILYGIYIIISIYLAFYHSCVTQSAGSVTNLLHKTNAIANTILNLKRKSDRI